MRFEIVLVSRRMFVESKKRGKLESREKRRAKSREKGRMKEGGDRERERGEGLIMSKKKGCGVGLRAWPRAFERRFVGRP